jgi:hypothetical protein
MAKAKPFMIVEMPVEQRDVAYAAECVTDFLYDEFESEVFEMLGFNGKAFREELLTFEPFLEEVKEAVSKHGYEALECPYDYIDYHDVYATKEWKSLWRVCNELQQVLVDIERESSVETACADAIMTLKRAGFKITRA